MKRLTTTFIIVLCCFASKGQSVKSVAERYAAIPGAYEGKLPCGDCSGIEASLILQCAAPCISGKYHMRDKYLNTPKGDRVNRTTGNWRVLNKSTKKDRNKWVIELDPETPAKATYYLITKDGNLQPLDKEMKQIDAPFDITLKKQ